MDRIKNIWSEDQAGLLKFCLHNIITTFTKITHYISEKFYLATPFNQGYRFFDLESTSLEDIMFKATEVLKKNNLSCVNLENADGIPILRIRLEPGPAVIIEDYITDETLCTILL
ncbi:MAG: hypothetical protein ACFE9L_09460 [Candidatus Hodarchaeota archaeon]